MSQLWRDHCDDDMGRECVCVWYVGGGGVGEGDWRIEIEFQEKNTHSAARSPYHHSTALFLCSSA